MGSHLPSTPRRPAGDVSVSPVAAVHLPGLHLDELRDWLLREEQQRYRAEQIFDWIYTKHATSFEQMSNLPKALRRWLEQNSTIYSGTITRESTAADGTRKLLITWPDGATSETVWIPHEGRNTACLSSQVGCPVGCRFCASGLGGLRRNLTAGEIVEQALHVQRLIRSAGDDGRLGNVVLMGTGEPLANYDEVMRAIRILNAPWGMGIGARRITLSTVGLPRRIRQLASEDLQLNLALSLHAADDQLRRKLIPWGRAPIAELLDACDYYFRHSGREITLEYVLLEGVNDSGQQARRLAELARRLRCNVNLLRYNPVPGMPYARPTSAATREFQQRLRAAGVNVQLRRSRGADIDAACGQLRRRAEREA